MGDRRDLHAAISLWQAALDDSPNGDPGRPFLMSTLSVALLARHQHLADGTDLTRAIELAGRAISAALESDPNRGVYANRFGLAKQSLYEKSESPADLEAAIAAFRLAVEVSQTAGPVAGDSKANLARALLARMNEGDLEEALLLFDAALREPSTSQTRRVRFSQRISAGGRR